MVVSTFFISNKDIKERFFKKSFLWADVKLNIVLRMFFLTINNIDIDAQWRDLSWRSYTTRNILLITKQIKLMEKKKFIIAVFYLKYKTCIIYIAAFYINSDDEMYLLRNTQMTYLKANEAFIKISSKYADFVDVFLPKLVVKLLKYTRINDYTIKLVDNWRFFYDSIDSLGIVKLEILKTYIKKNLINALIKPFKFFARAFIFFYKKLDKSL